MRLEPDRLVFIDETGTTTKMTRLRGRCLKGRRLRSKAPFGHWKTQTFVAGLRSDGLTAPFVVDQPMNRRIFEVYVETQLASTLKPGDVVIMDNLADIFHPRETGSVHLGGIVRRQPHPAAPEVPLGGGPQMVEVSRDGRRVYVTNSIYGAWDPIFYPDGVGAWAAKLDTDPQAGGLAADRRFFPNGEDFRGLRVHQTRLQAGDASSDSYCFTS
jgi:selenium-binding protein 1